jgi:hypothetical protein
MSSGRSSTIACGDWGRIEFIHTTQLPAALAPHLHYDADCRLWRASVDQALRDMKSARRPLDLVDWHAGKELRT